MKEKSELITELSNQILGLRQKIGGDYKASRDLYKGMGGDEGIRR